MNRADCLIYLKEEEKTENILSIRKDMESGNIIVRFVGSLKEYVYKIGDVKIYKGEMLNPAFYQIYYNGRLYENLTAIYRYKEVRRWYLVRGEQQYFHSDDQLEVIHSVLEDGKVSSVLDYLKRVSFVNPLNDHLLSRRFEKIDFLNSESLLASYLSGTLIESQSKTPELIIYPFGTNRSQKQAVAKALSNRLSVIQGPPGTGKTQTILTIIANLLIQGKTIEVISYNNEAVENVKEKLVKYDLSFLVASMGSDENKQRFIENQRKARPDISSWKLEENELKVAAGKIQELSTRLDDCYVATEELKKKVAELSTLEMEIQHFQVFNHENIALRKDDLSAQGLMETLQEYIIYFDSHESFSILKRLSVAFIHKTLTWAESAQSGNDVIQNLQWRYYCKKRSELLSTIQSLEDKVRNFNMEKKSKELEELSIKYLKGALYEKVKDRKERVLLTKEDLWKTPEKLVEEYPIITSSAYSASSSLSRQMYDYVILDEASQCDIASGALSLLRARNAVIVGDVKQLQNVVTDKDRDYVDSVFAKYKISEYYKYSCYSFLSSILALFPSLVRTLLCEHYRCQRRIIEFCNQKFYDSSLVIMTKDEKVNEELSLYLTGKGHHRRDYANQRQADIIANEILPTLSSEESIGIITPYNNNVDLIKATIKRDDIKVATIHSFQGREMDTIIYSTCDDTATEFSDSPNLINVAVSRAKKHFILVASENEQPADSNLHDLIAYISYNNLKTVHTGIRSIFDLLYEEATEARIKYLSNHRKISRYDSENLMFAAIVDIIKSKSFKPYGFYVASHYPLRYLFTDNNLTEEEKQYISKTGTHVDFLIYRKIGKRPVLAIEVDGFHYHKKGTRQSERDILKDSIFKKNSLTLFRFKTNGSGEVEDINKYLNRYINIVI